MSFKWQRVVRGEPKYSERWQQVVSSYTMETRTTETEEAPEGEGWTLTHKDTK